MVERMSLSGSRLVESGVLKPPRVTGFKLSKDKQFQERL